MTNTMAHIGVSIYYLPNPSSSSLLEEPIVQNVDLWSDMTETGGVDYAGECHECASHPKSEMPALQQEGQRYLNIFADIWWHIL